MDKVLIAPRVIYFDIHNLILSIPSIGKFMPRKHYDLMGELCLSRMAFYVQRSARAGRRLINRELDITYNTCDVERLYHFIGNKDEVNRLVGFIDKLVYKHFGEYLSGSNPFEYTGWYLTTYKPKKATVYNRTSFGVAMPWVNYKGQMFSLDKWAKQIVPRIYKKKFKTEMGDFYYNKPLSSFIGGDIETILNNIKNRGL